jgi:hypothetical protein
MNYLPFIYIAGSFRYGLERRKHFLPVLLDPHDLLNSQERLFTIKRAAKKLGVKKAELKSVVEQESVYPLLSWLTIRRGGPCFPFRNKRKYHPNILTTVQPLLPPGASL